jgi:hypothetical protein
MNEWGREMSSAEIERHLPYTSRVIMRTPWETSDHLTVNAFRGRITNDYRCGHWNEITTYHFTRQTQAAEFTEFIRTNRLHRLHRNCTKGAGQAEVALEWMRLCDERQLILAWGRAEKGRLMEVVQSYRFARRDGRYNAAHDAAGKTVVQLDPTVGDPMNYAGVLIEWAEREHREWFWRCCLKHQVL